MANNKITFWNSLLLGLGLGIAVNAHFTGVFLIIVSAIWLILNKKISKNLIISFLILLVFVSPLFLFDYRHNFFNYNSALDFFRGNKELIPISFSLKITRFIHNLSLSLELFGSLFIGKVSFWGKPILGIVGLMLIVFNLFKVNNFSKNKYKLFFLYLLSPCLLFVYYNGAIPEYYLFLLLPVFILATSDIVSKVIINKHFYTIAVLILTFVIIHDLNLVKSTSEDGLYNKKQIINRIKAQSVKLTYIMSMGQDVGYKYLLDLKKIKIDNNAETEAIIKFPILDDVRKSDYYLSGNIGIKLKDKSYDQNFIDYWNQNYKFAFDLPRDLTIISCDLVKSETLISDRNSGSCYLPYLDSKTKMLFITGEENKLYKIFNDFNGQEFNTSIISRNFIPGKRKIMNDNLVSYIFIIPNQNKSILFELQMENNDKMFEKFIHIIQSIRIYED